MPRPRIVVASALALACVTPARADDKARGDTAEGPMPWFSVVPAAGVRSFIETGVSRREKIGSDPVDPRPYFQVAFELGNEGVGFEFAPYGGLFKLGLSLGPYHRWRFGASYVSAGVGVRGGFTTRDVPHGNELGLEYYVGAPLGVTHYVAPWLGLDVEIVPGFGALENSGNDGEVYEGRGILLDVLLGLRFP